MSRRTASQQAQRAVHGTDGARRCAIPPGLVALADGLVHPMAIRLHAASWGSRPRAAAMTGATRPPGRNAESRHQSATHWPTGECALRSGQR